MSVYAIVKSTKEKLPIDPTGEIWFDQDIRGNYTECAIIRMAINYGFKCEPVEKILSMDYDQAKDQANNRYQNPYDVLISELESYYEISEEADNYLQKEIILPSGYYIGYSEFGAYYGIIKEDESEETFEE